MAHSTYRLMEGLEAVEDTLHWVYAHCMLYVVAVVT